MSLTFPLTVNQFYQGLLVAGGSFYLPPKYEISGENGAGEVLMAARGVRLWRGSIEVARSSYKSANAIKAQIAALAGVGRSFHIFDKSNAAPAADPTGAILGAAVPTITGISSDRRDVTIGGLPAGYVLTTGDVFSFNYGSNPVRAGYYQILVGGTANGSGAVTVEVTDALRTGITTGIQLRFIKAYCKAIIIPDSVGEANSSGLVTSGISFGFTQTLR